MNTTENYRFKVGALKCSAISDRTERFPLDTIVRDISPEQLRQALLECGCSPTENIAYYNCLYIETEQHRILIDAGWGKDIRAFGGVNWYLYLVLTCPSQELGEFLAMEKGGDGSRWLKHRTGDPAT